MSLSLPEGVPPEAILAALHGGAGAGQAGPPLPHGMGDHGYDQNESPLEVLQDCINGLPRVIAALPDPQDTQDATQALLVLTRIQTRLMNRQGGSGGPQPQG